jgi:hypothetical protein
MSIIYRPLDEGEISPNIKRKYSELYAMAEKMTSISRFRRPICEDLLQKVDSWSIRLDELKDDLDFKNILGSTNHKNEFHNFFINVKWKNRKTN